MLCLDIFIYKINLSLVNYKSYCLIKIYNFINVYNFKQIKNLMKAKFLS